MSEGSEVFEGRVPTMVRLQLAELVAANGAEILGDPRRVRAMLADTASTAVREINLINLALSLGVPERLAAAAGDPLRLQTEIENLTRQLERNNALQRDAADWAVRSCAWSLGLVSPPEDLEPVAAAPVPSPLAPTPLPTEPVPTEPVVDQPPAEEPIAPAEVIPPPVASPIERPAEPAPVVPPPAPPARATSSREPAKRKTPLLLVLGAATVAIVVFVGGIVLVTSGGGGGDKKGSGATGGAKSRFTPAQQRLMAALPAIAPITSCRPEASRPSIDCRVDMGPAGSGGSTVEHIEYFTHTSEASAVTDAFYFAPRNNPVEAPAPTTWANPSGLVGGEVQRWVTHPSGDELHHLAWTFRIGDTYYAATTAACCGAPAATVLDDWWRTNAITSDKLADVPSH
jgi:hypothetical protein